MKRIIIALAWLTFCGFANAANIDIPGLPAASSVTGTDLFECSQAGTSRKCTATQDSAFIFGLVSGDVTLNGSGVATLKNTGPGATGPLGSATVAPVVTIDAQGRVTGLTSATIAPPFSAVTGTVAPGQLPLATSAQFGAVKVDNTTITASAGVITAVGGSATSVTSGTTTVGGSCTTGFNLYNNAGTLGCQANNTGGAVNIFPGAPASGQWQTPFAPWTLTAGAVGVGGTTMYCQYGVVGQSTTIKTLAVNVTTLGTTNAQLGIYSGGNSGTLTLVDHTADIATTTPTGIKTGALAGTTATLAAGTYWWCVQSNDTSVIYQSFTQTGTWAASMIGAASAVNLLGATSVTGRSFATGGYGTWPATLTYSAGTEVDSRQPPAIAFQVN